MIAKIRVILKSSISSKTVDPQAELNLWYNLLIIESSEQITIAPFVEHKY
jgi:hypothetical protein